MTEYLPHQFGPALEEWARTELPAWIGEGHAELIAIVGHGAIDRTTIRTGELVNNWQGWEGDSTIAVKVPKVTVFGPSAHAARLQIDALASRVRMAGRSGTVVEKTVILNNADYALIEEEGNAKRRGKHMALGAVDEAEVKWGQDQ